MSDPIRTSDPLNPAYVHDPAVPQDAPRLKGWTNRSGLAVLIVIAAVVLAVLAILGRETPAEEQVPVATEIQP